MKKQLTMKKTIIGRTSKPTVSVNEKDVSMFWNYQEDPKELDIYLVRASWRWDDINCQVAITLKGKNYTFGSVALGEYRAFIVARPNFDMEQSEWT